MLQNECNEWDKKFEKAEDPSLFTGIAFVSFEFIKDKEKVEAKF